MDDVVRPIRQRHIARLKMQRRPAGDTAAAANLGHVPFDHRADGHNHASLVDDGFGQRRREARSLNCARRRKRLVDARPQQGSFVQLALALGHAGHDSGVERRGIGNRRIRGRLGHNVRIRIERSRIGLYRRWSPRGMVGHIRPIDGLAIRLGNRRRRLGLGHTRLQYRSRALFVAGRNHRRRRRRNAHPRILRNDGNCDKKKCSGRDR